MLLKIKEGVELEGGLPEGVRSVGGNAAGVLVFESSLEQMPDGFVACGVDDVVGLPSHREAKSVINADRDRAIGSGAYIESLDITLDTDPKSVQRIAGASILAMMPIVKALYTIEFERAVAAEDEATQQALIKAEAHFSTPWIDADNKQFEMGFGELLQIAPALAAHEKGLVFGAFAQKAEVLPKLAAAYGVVEASDS